MQIKKIAIFFYTASVLFACKKNTPNHSNEVSQGGVQKDTVYTFTCKDIGQGGAFGWQDINLYSDSAIRCWYYNPSNQNEVIYSSIGSAAYHTISLVNLKTKSRKLLDAGCMYLPEVNRKGWLVYENLNFDIYKVKTNGDSLTLLVSGGEDPKWDYSGNYIYYYRGGSNPKTYKIDKNGTKVDSLVTPVFFAAFGKVTNKCAYMNVENNVGYVNIRDISANSEKRLLTGNNPSNKALYGFSHLTFDNLDRYLYWWNQMGVFRCDMQGNTETIIESCDLMFNNYSFQVCYISPSVDKLTFVYELRQPLNTVQLYHQYKTFEYDLITRKLKEVKLF